MLRSALFAMLFFFSFSVVGHTAAVETAPTPKAKAVAGIVSGCFDEDAAIAIANADMKSLEVLIGEWAVYKSLGLCTTGPDTAVQLEEQILKYTSHDGREMEVWKVLGHSFWTFVYPENVHYIGHKI